MSRYDDLSDEARAVLDEMDELTMAEVIVDYGAALDRVRQLAADMRDWCSPHGVATVYADRLLEALNGPPTPPAR